MKLVVLGLGSNRDFEDRSSVRLLHEACDKLKRFLSNFRTSSVYRTKPMYYEEQSSFYNMVACGYADDNLSPYEFLDEIHDIESSLGRDRSKEIRNGPRSIDIDIEFWGDETINTENLVIPHPRIEERPFVVVPLLEILQKNADIKLKKDFSVISQKINLCDAEKLFSAEDFAENIQ